MEMKLYDDIIEKIHKMREKNLEPGAIVVGENKLGQLEEEVGSSTISLDRSLEEYIEGAAVAVLSGVKMYLNPVRDDKCYVVPQRIVEDMATEYYNNE